MTLPPPLKKRPLSPRDQSGMSAYPQKELAGKEGKPSLFLIRKQLDLCGIQRSF